MASTQSAELLADPAAPAWKDIASQAVSLSPVPLDAQPTEYVRVAWENRPYGTVRDVSVAVAREGDRVVVRMEWDDPADGHTEFPDSAAVYFPLDSTDGSPSTFGTPEHPVDLWLWRSSRSDAIRASATGPGAFRRDDDPQVEVSGALQDGRWSVVFSGVPKGGGDRLGVAVWDGANEERAGIGATTSSWLPTAQR